MGFLVSQRKHHNDANIQLKLAAKEKVNKRRKRSPSRKKKRTKRSPDPNYGYQSSNTLSITDIAPVKTNKVKETYKPRHHRSRKTFTKEERAKAIEEMQSSAQTRKHLLKKSKRSNSPPSIPTQKSFVNDLMSSVNGVLDHT